MLLIEELHKRFSNGFVGLGSIDLTVNRSEIISLIGTSGCGKSTILRIMRVYLFRLVAWFALMTRSLLNPIQKLVLSSKSHG